MKNTKNILIIVLSLFMIYSCNNPEKKIEEEVKKEIGKLLFVPAKRIKNTHYLENIGFDELDQIELIIILEERYSITMSDEYYEQHCIMRTPISKNIATVQTIIDWVLLETDGGKSVITLEKLELSEMSEVLRNKININSKIYHFTYQDFVYTFFGKPAFFIDNNKENLVTISDEIKGISSLDYTDTLNNEITPIFIYDLPAVQIEITDTEKIKDEALRGVSEYVPKFIGLVKYQNKYRYFVYGYNIQNTTTFREVTTEINANISEGSGKTADDFYNDIINYLKQ